MVFPWFSHRLTNYQRVDGYTVWVTSMVRLPEDHIPTDLIHWSGLLIFHRFFYVYQSVNLHFPLLFLCFSYGFPIKNQIFLWFSYGFPIKTNIFLWFSHQNLHFPMVVPWFSHQNLHFAMVFPLFSHQNLHFPMVFPWFSH